MCFINNGVLFLMLRDSFFRGCRADEHKNKSSDASSVISASAFYPDERQLSPKNTFDTSICWRDDDNALSFFYSNDRKKFQGNNTRSGISELDFSMVQRNLKDHDLLDIVSFNHDEDPTDKENTYHGNISFHRDYMIFLEQKFPDMGKKARKRQVCEQIALAEKSFYTPHDLQCLFPEK